MQRLLCVELDIYSGGVLAGRQWRARVDHVGGVGDARERVVVVAVRVLWLVGTLRGAKEKR